MDTKQALIRTTAICLSALGCGLVSALASGYLELPTQSPEPSMFYQQSGWRLWFSDIGVTMVASLSLATSPFALALLWRTNLWLTIPITAITTIITAALFGHSNWTPLLAPLVGLLTMVACRICRVGIRDSLETNSSDLEVPGK